ncbi:MAG: putative Fe-S cluster assembly protein SufT [Pseudomonadota bacterium]|nr:putative Fe-S cluster assembly protein SufT [Pseudomonadota bacterium]
MYSQQADYATLSRDCLGVLIPAGDTVVLPEGADVRITQALGGSFTVYYGGNLVRIAGKDADALGREVPAGPELPEDADDAAVESCIEDQLKTCFDPEIPINIVDLGLIYDRMVEMLPEGGRAVHIRMTLTAPGCGMGDILADEVRAKVAAVPTVKRVSVELTFDPPWDQSRMSEAARLQTGMY